MAAQSRFSQCWQHKIVKSALLVGVLTFAIHENGSAQIVPDNTLGSESSTVTPNIIVRGVIGDRVASNRIDGGALRGTNLFHSFSQFSIGTGQGAYFSNPSGVSHIFSRVTGTTRSDISGRLGVLGGANLFLINPNGIVFGADSSLDVRGSFLATTANAIRFGDIGLFSASQPTTSNLLSVNPSALWFNAIAASPIINRSQSSGALNQPNSAGLAPGLQVQSGRTLALVGGDVSLEGNLNASAGRIELGSVVSVGNVTITQSGDRFVLGYGSIQMGEIAIANRAFVDVSGDGGGDIQIHGARLDMAENANVRAITLGAQNGGEIVIRTAETTLRQGSSLSTDVIRTGTGGNITIDTGRLIVRDGANITSITAGAGNSGRLQITATDAIELVGRSTDNQVPSSLSTTSQGTGNAGAMRIDTKRMVVRNGAGVFTSTSGTGKGGRLQITATDAIELTGGDLADGRVASGLFAQSQGSGDAGEMRINTGRLIVRDGGRVSTTAFSTGKGGSLQITATDTIEVAGRSADNRFSSGLDGQSQGSGDAGEMRINTGRLIVRDGGRISTTAFNAGKGGSLQIVATDAIEVAGRSADGQVPSSLATQSTSRASGNAGELKVETRRLIVRDGAQVTTGTFGVGKGGSLQIIATDSIELTGRFTGGLFATGLATQSSVSGDAGNLKINTGRLIVRGAAISSANTGNGRAGDINITARDALQIENGGISTRASRSAGGAIQIQARTIRLVSNSDIRSNVASGADNGGNITLTANSILAFGDSDIFAFARDGRGGNITLNTPAFFGENYRPSAATPDTLDNNNRVDINATGAINGIITLPDVSFIQNSLSDLPDNVINTDTLLANSCIARRVAEQFPSRGTRSTQGNFTVTGTGGFPQRPGDAQRSNFPTTEIETLPTRNPSPNRAWQKGDPIVEPQGVYRLPDGKLVLSRDCS